MKNHTHTHTPKNLQRIFNTVTVWYHTEKNSCPEFIEYYKTTKQDAEDQANAMLKNLPFSSIVDVRGDTLLLTVSHTKKQERPLVQKLIDAFNSVKQKNKKHA